MFTFNAYSGPLLIGFLQGLIYAGLFFRRGLLLQRLSDRLFAALLLVATLTVGQWMFGFADWYDVHDWRTTIMFYFPWHHPFLFGPLVYVYFRTLTNPSVQSLRPYRWHFLLFGLAFLEPLTVFFHDLLWLHWLQGAPLAYFHKTRGPWSEFLNTTNSPIFGVVNVLDKLHFLVYLILTIIAYRQYRRYLLANFSNEEARTFDWLRNVLYLVFTGIGIFQLSILVSWYIYPMDYGEIWYAYLALGIMIYVVAIQAYHATNDLPEDIRFSPQLLSAPPATTVLVSSEISSELDEWKVKLNDYMERERPYLEADLTLSELADRLDTNTSTLSRAINTGFDQNFNDFINTYRVAAFEAAVRSGQHQQQTLLGIALDCGFNSKATFNRSYRKLRGKTPGEYIKEQPDRSNSA